MLYDVSGNILFNSKRADFADNMELNYDSYDTSSGETTNYIFLRIFQTKKDGTKQYPFVRVPQTSGGAANRMATTALAASEDWLLIINSGLGVSAEQPYDGVLIENGVVKNGDPATYHVGSQPLTIDANGNLSYAAADATGAGLIASNVVSNGVITSGIVSACCGFCPLIVDFEKVSFPNVVINNDGNHFAENAQRQIIGQFGNGDYGIISCEGRDFDNSEGWTLTEAQDVCYRLGMKFAYNLDGGKSTSTILGKKLVTTNYATYSSSPRSLPSFIVFNGGTQFAVPG